MSGFPPGGSTPLHTELVRAYGALDGTAWAGLVAAARDRVAAARGLDPRRLRATLLDDPEPRAFALPGGFLYVSRGLLARLTSAVDLDRVLVEHVAEALRDDPGRAERDAAWWADLRGIGWPAREGPAESLFERVDTALGARLEPREAPEDATRDEAFLEAIRELPSGADPELGRWEHDDRFVQRALGFALAMPRDWQVRSSRELCVVRPPEANAALELLSFPSPLPLDGIARRALADLGELRGVEVEESAHEGAELAGLPARAVTLRLRRGRSEHPVRALFARAGGTVWRLVATAELRATWDDPELLAGLGARFALLESPIPPRTDPPTHRIDT